VAIPAKSPGFDPDWAAHGHIDTVLRNAAVWVEAQKVEGLTLEVVRLPDNLHAQGHKPASGPTLVAAPPVAADSSRAFRPQVVPFEREGQAAVFRLRTGGFADAAAAGAFCEQVRTRNVPCTVIR
jgi:hypothetical protein